MAQMGPFLNRAKLATKYRPGSWPLYRQETTPERPIWPSKRTISAPLETKATPILFQKSSSVASFRLPFTGPFTSYLLGLKQPY